MKKLLFTILLVITACRGTTGHDGATIQGPKGDTGSIGATGPSGNDGVNGSDGVSIQGPAGADGTQITIVQLCPGVTTTYPGVFVEVGICIEGKLYGVYSQNGGFMTYLADGAYTSNAIGSACNLVVHGCQVE